MKSSLNIEELEQSTRNLSQLDLKYSVFQNVLGTSQRLIKHLEQADKWDRTCMLASLGFLALVLTWIVWRRILKPPVYLLLSVIRVFIFSGKKVAQVVTPNGTKSAIVDIANTVETIETLTETIIDATSTLLENAVTSIVEAATDTVDHPDL